MENLGTGLGLSLVKQIVEKYNGKIFVESKIGQGSTFTVEMPYLNLQINPK
ncbi:MAG TPA: ATP-binding protein [Candidatus Marinimicrobia bacterium]|nr:ATP-binding protein [Candidatus Neomarinimicrobiota bacterium]